MMDLNSLGNRITQMSQDDSMKLILDVRYRRRMASSIEVSRKKASAGSKAAKRDNKPVILNAKTAKVSSSDIEALKKLIGI